MNNDNDQNQPLPNQQPIVTGSNQGPQTSDVSQPVSVSQSSEPDFLNPPSSYNKPIMQSQTEVSMPQPSGQSSDSLNNDVASASTPSESVSPTLPSTLPPQSPPDLSVVDSNASKVPIQDGSNIAEASDVSGSDQRNSSGFIKKALKILLGLFIILVVLGVIYFLIQRFSGGSTKVTLSYWGLWEDEKIMQSVISDFQRQNPNITIDYKKQDIKQYRDRLIARMNNGTGPDIFRIHNSWVSMLSQILLPIPSDTISKSQFQSIYYPVASADLIKNGAIYAVPLEIDTLALYINTQAFQNAGIQPPTNWNEFIDAARALTVKDQDGKIKTAGAGVGTYDNINHASDIVSLLFLQNSVNLRDLSSSSDRANGALNFYTSFATDQDNVWDNTLDPTTLAFAKGNLAMYFGYSWDFFTIKQFNPNLAFRIVAVPQLPNQNVNLASYWAEAASVKTKHQKEALQFIKFLTQKDTEQKLYTEEAKTREFGEPYARVDLGDTLKDNPIVYPFVVQAKTAQSSYFIDQTYDNAINQQSNTYLGNTVNSLIGNSSSGSSFDTLSKGITQVLTQYGW